MPKGIYKRIKKVIKKPNIDLTRKKFNKLLVIKFAFIKKERTYWVCKCDCNKIKVIRGDSIISGDTKSCGCLRKKMASERFKKSIGKNNNKWSEYPSYNAVHAWVKWYKGKATKCKSCGRTTPNKIEWCNINHKYKRRLKDYISLCTSCHRIYDIKNNKYEIGFKKCSNRSRRTKSVGRMARD